MLTGTFFHLLDRKGRCVIPAGFRRVLGESFVVTRAPEGCLLAMSSRQWTRYALRHAADPVFREYFLSGAVHVQANPEGRIQLPVALREHAGLTRGTEVAVAGLGAVVSLCPRARWDVRLRYQEERVLAALAPS